MTPVNKPAKDLGTAVGKKLVMAMTGLLMVIYLIAHLAGNLILLAGPEKYNSYANVLVHLPVTVAIELALLAIFLWHVYRGITVWLGNKQARPDGYQVQRWATAKSPHSRKTLSSTTMMVSGSLLFLFIVLHVWHFKYGPHYPYPPAPASVTTLGVPTGPPAEMRDLHRLVVEEFRKPLIAVLYMLAMLVVGFHLYHANASAIQSLGLEHHRLTPWVLAGSKILAILLGAGFAFLPLWVWLLGGAGQ